MNDILVSSIETVASAGDRLKAGEVLYEQNVHGRRDRRKDPPVILLRRDGEPRPEFPYNTLVLENLIDLFPSSISDRLERSLVSMIKVSQIPGATISHDFKLQRLVFAENVAGLNWLLQQLGSEGLITQANGRDVQVTAKGWTRVAELERERGRKTGRRGFIAMPFSPADVREAIRPALVKGVTDAGYEPVVVDLLEHNEKICDRIIAEIRRSRFVVADFTLQKQNVYFEAGFALGLGIPVIWTCRDNDIANAHFDTRQYNHVVWDGPDSLASKLTNRILATIA